MWPAGLADQQLYLGRWVPRLKKSAEIAEKACYHVPITLPFFCY